MPLHSSTDLQEKTKLIGEKEDTRLKYGTAEREKTKPLKTKQTNPESSSGLLGLFRYSTKGDLVILLIGLLFATAHGASFPILALVFGEMTNTFMKQATMGFKSSTTQDSNSTLNETWQNESQKFFSTTTDNNSHAITQHYGEPLTIEEFTAYMGSFSLYYFLIGMGVLLASFIQTLCWEVACERQVYRLRNIFFRQVLRQDITWFDVHEHGDLNTKLADDLERVREGIGSKFSMVLQYISTFISGISVGFYANWKLTGVILLAGPLLIGTSAFMAKVVPFTIIKSNPDCNI